MKNLAVSLILAASALSAHAADVATAPNSANGSMVLTDSPTGYNWRCTRGLVIYATDPSGNVVTRGCWNSDSDWVYVQWDTDSVQTPNHRFLANSWQLTDYAKQEIKARGKLF